MRIGWVCLFAGIALHATPAASPRTNALQVQISAAEPMAALPFAKRITLHFRNVGQKPVWLYRPVRSATSPPSAASGSGGISGEIWASGSMLSVALKPAQGVMIVSPASAKALASVGLPHPRLIELVPGAVADQTVLLQFTPAEQQGASGVRPIWGQYSLTVRYAAQFANADQLARDLGVFLWTGEIQTNSIPIVLQAPQGHGAVSGVIEAPNAQSMPDALVSLSDSQLRLLDQEVSDDEGRFSFSGLPWGLYWVMVRQSTANVDTTVVRHFVVSGGNPSESAQMMLLPLDIYSAKQVLHKPVILEVTDSEGHPLDDVTLKILSAQEPVVESLRARTGAEGLCEAELIPGSIYLTLERRGCQKEDQRIEVPPGAGVAGFKLQLDCAGK